MRRFAFYLIEVLTIFLMLTAYQTVFGAETSCADIWHDHYKVNYRKRHKHKVCESVAKHYREDESRSTMMLYYPGVYLGEVLENEEDKVTIKNLRKLLSEQEK